MEKGIWKLNQGSRFDNHKIRCTVRGEVGIAIARDVGYPVDCGEMRQSEEATTTSSFFLLEKKLLSRKFTQYDIETQLACSSNIIIIRLYYQARLGSEVSRVLLAVRHESHVFFIISTVRTFVELRFRFRMRSISR